MAGLTTTPSMAAPTMICSSGGTGFDLAVFSGIAAVYADLNLEPRAEKATTRWRASRACSGDGRQRYAVGRQ
jgi:hypothetical protein